MSWKTCIVVGFPQDIKGDGIYAFVTQISPSLYNIIGNQ